MRSPVALEESSLSSVLERPKQAKLKKQSGEPQAPIVPLAVGVPESSTLLGFQTNLQDYMHFNGFMHRSGPLLNTLDPAGQTSRRLDVKYSAPRAWTTLEYPKMNMGTERLCAVLRVRDEATVCINASTGAAPDPC